MNSTKLKLDQLLITFKDVRLICHNLSSQGLMEQIKQLVFSEKKRLDIIRFNKSKKMKELTKLKIYAGELEDQVRNEESRFRVSTRTELACQRLTGRIQNRNLLFEAAISVSNFYKIILNLLKRDSIFYEKILFALQGDLIAQNRCICEAIVIGQTSVEYLDNKRIDFRRLYAAVKKSRNKRNVDFSEAEEIFKKIPFSVKGAIRRDDDIPGNIIRDDDMREKQLEKLRRELETKLRILKKTIMVSNFEEILPCLKEQINMNQKLHSLWSILERNRTNLSDKIEKANMAYNEICNNNYDETETYIKKRKTLENQIANKKEDIKNLEQDRRKRTKILTDIRVTIDNLKMTCDLVRDDVIKTEKMSVSRRALNVVDDMTYITYKIKYLISGLREEDAEPWSGIIDPEAYRAFAPDHVLDEVEIEVDAKDFEDFAIDNTILSHQEIKEQSRQIVELFKSSEY